jgi:hypothetical protein
MVARGEREARSPWNVREKKYRPGRPTEMGQSICRPSGARALFICDPGAACSRRSGSWLPSGAPTALRNPGYLLARLRRSGSWLPSTAPAALRNPGYPLPRLRRFGTLRAPPARTNNDVNFRDRTLALYESSADRQGLTGDEGGIV